MLARIPDLKDEMSTFLDFQSKHDFLLLFQSEKFQLAMAYLLDIFEALNRLDLLLQGKNNKRIDDHNTLNSFMTKLGLWYRRVQNGIAALFPTLDTSLENYKAKVEDELKAEVESHLLILKG